MKDGRNERQGRARNYSGAVVESEPSSNDGPSGFAAATVTYKIVCRL
jgi:hypothetical protein